MKLRFVLLSIFIFISVLACGHNLVEDIYAHARQGEDKEATTAFVALSNIVLSKSDIASLEKDYEMENVLKRKYYYEFLLSKRTQEQKYIIAFIKNSKNNLSALLENNTNWISISSPFYKHLSFYSKTNDEALAILFKLAKIADGAILSIIVEDLSEIRKNNPKRFLMTAKDAGFQNYGLLKLMEDE